jgi:hypothetical protein
MEEWNNGEKRRVRSPSEPFFSDRSGNGPYSFLLIHHSIIPLYHLFRNLCSNPYIRKDF